MRKLERSIEQVREERGDLSSWLVHLTKANVFLDEKDGTYTNISAKKCLERIIEDGTIKAHSSVGQFNYKQWYKNVSPDDLEAVCFSEAPIEEIFLFCNIKYKPLKFEPYGLVFDKNDLLKDPVFAAPVMYFGQPEGSDHFLKIMDKLEQEHCEDFKDILYLFDKFGSTYKGTNYDFRWEREWRIKGSFEKISKYIKFGLCPESDIDYFENKFSDIPFVDPFFHPKQIQFKLQKYRVIKNY